MARTSESGRPVGGIGTMLMQSDICPACGKVHDTRLVRYLPAVGQLVAGLDPTTPNTASSTGAGGRVRARKPSSQPMAWPMPQLSEGYP